MAYWGEISINKVYKITFQLKNRWYLFPLRKELFYISDVSNPVKSEELEELWYWKILKDHCNWICKKWYIWWLTALEVYLYGNGITIPEKIMVVNKEKQLVETIIFDKKIMLKKFECKWKNLISSLIKQTEEVSFLNCKNVLVANLELAILECLYNFDTSNWWYIEECIKKAIKKNWKTLKIENIESIIKLWKHNTSLNRLYVLIKDTYPALSQDIKNLVKKYGFLL